MIIKDAKTGIKWFKDNFGEDINVAVYGTPFTPDMVCAIAYQETGYIWSQLVNKGLIKKEILYLCVGDTLDADKGRMAFPRTALRMQLHSQEIFNVARKALLEMSKYVSGYGFAVKNQNKFAHGFGIFQYDLQFCKKNPDFFKRELWRDFSECLKLLIAELYEALKRQGWAAKTKLTRKEKVYVCIAYNRGTADTAKGFKQGHKSDSGKYYGENIDSYLDMFV